jgi:hypothetical protein
MTWLFWTVPVELAFDYLIKLGLFLIIIPMLFGVMLTTTGLFFNFLIVDFLIYLQYNNLKRR